MALSARAVLLGKPMNLLFILLTQCVMCFRTAEAQQVERARVLNEGILLLGIPPLCILAIFVYLAYRHR